MSYQKVWVKGTLIIINIPNGLMRKLRREMLTEHETVG